MVGTAHATFNPGLKSSLTGPPFVIPIKLALDQAGWVQLKKEHVIRVLMPNNFLLEVKAKQHSTDTHTHLHTYTL